MSRASNTPATRRRRNKIKSLASGYVGAKGNSFKKAKEQLMKSSFYSYRDRKKKTSQIRQLSQLRINAELDKEKGINYSIFINSLKELSEGPICITRRSISEMAI
jgi:large subunit ribosomal protein L20